MADDRDLTSHIFRARAISSILLLHAVVAPTDGEQWLPLLLPPPSLRVRRPLPSPPRP